ncbi:uncharacterized protein [Misgurnus anguillicaudatus]|uniref:uncharacterized protein isoform X1 n=1 Tax=Misgurnus anguillicaudatus TaxID=75329 RepID=UPI003CCF26E4
MFLMFVYLSLCFRTLTGVFGDEVKSVSVMEGDSLTLHSNLTEIQSKYVIRWRFGLQQIRIAEINKEANKISIYDDVLDGRFRDRLQVNDQTGDLTITDIRTTDSGHYQIIIRSKRKSSYRFNIIVNANLHRAALKDLKVPNRLNPAHLHVPVIYSNCPQNSSSASQRVLLLCSVLNMRDVSLSWYKGNSLLSIISVSDLNIRLSLPLEVEYQDTNTYRCVLNNTNTNQTQHLNITQLCQPCLTGDNVILIS